MKLDLRFLALLGCFILSGTAALIYQTVWSRQFALIFGTSELALVTVLAAYMAGLAVGAAAANRFLAVVRRPVLTYALLELGIALAALAIPFAIDLISALHVVVLGGQDFSTALPSASTLAFYLLTSFVVLVIPTAMMGATLPLLARSAIREEAQISSRIGALYTANTLGAAVGALLAAFVLFPMLGSSNTILVAVALNGAVFFLALATRKDTKQAYEPTQELLQPLQCRWILPIMMASGAVSFSWEVMWTRLLVQLLGGTLYAFATMLATFLIGLAIGSFFVTRLIRSQSGAKTSFVASQIAIAACTAAGFANLDALVPLIGGTTDWATPHLKLFLSSLILLPGAIAIGATFPLAVRILAERAEQAASASARVFAWNTIGAIIGVIGAGYWLLPALQYEGSALVATSTSLGLALFSAMAMRPRQWRLAAVASLAVIVLVIVRLEPPWQILRYSPMAKATSGGEITYFGVGRSANVLLTQEHVGWRLATNGLPESSVEPSWGRPGRIVVARWLSLLPTTLRPEAKSMLVVGFGTGVTIEDVPSSVEKIDVLEIEPEVIKANEQVEHKRWRDPLADPRVQVHFSDARGALRLTDRQFDVIVSQPSHPWTSGASQLYTKEFFELVRSRLSSDGVFSQWMALGFTDAELFRDLVTTMNAVFRHVEVYQPTAGATVLVASEAPLPPPAGAMPHVEHWRGLGMRMPIDFLVTRVLDADTSKRFASEGSPITDTRNQFEIRVPETLVAPLTPATTEHLLADFDPNRPLLRDSAQAASTVLIAQRLFELGLRARLSRVAEDIANPSGRLTALAMTDLTTKRYRQGVDRLRAALQLDDANSTARALWLVHQRKGISEGHPVPATLLPLTEVESLIVDGWRFGQVNDWRSVQAREYSLMHIPQTHALYEHGLRLRAQWRVTSGDMQSAAEATALIEPLLAPTPQPMDFLLLAQAANTAGETERARTAAADAIRTARMVKPPHPAIAPARQLLTDIQRQ